MIASFLSHPVVFGTSWSEVLVLPAGLTVFLTLYHHLECHQTGCHRLGRFRHGYLKLCHAHHPKAPSDGRIGAQHINDITEGH